jgi:hypothetical protein
LSGLTGFLARLRSPGRKASSDAGPPDRWVFAGVGVGLLFIVVGWMSGVLRGVPWPLWALLPVGVLIVVSFADHDGWNIRRAMAYVAIQQRARWKGGEIPRTPSLAQRWLDDPANADADGLQKVSVLIALGDLAAATSMLETYVPTTDVQVAAVTRIRSYLRAIETGTVEMEPIRAAAANLAAEERRYQLTSSAWMQVWLDIEAHRPWRMRFADAIRDLGPHPVPGRVLAFIGLQQLIAPVATIIGTAISAVVLGW